MPVTLGDRADTLVPPSVQPLDRLGPWRTEQAWARPPRGTTAAHCGSAPSAASTCWSARPGCWSRRSSPTSSPRASSWWLPSSGHSGTSPGSAFAVLLTLSLLLHEVSHALVAQQFGIRVRSITLHFIGGVTAIDGEPRTPGRSSRSRRSGPVTSLGIGGLALALYQVTPGGLLSFVVGGLAWANLVVGVLNLVPGMPLDGGRVLRAVVWRITGSPHRGTLASGWAGRGVAVLMLASPLIMAAFGLPSRRHRLADRGRPRLVPLERRVRGRRVPGGCARGCPRCVDACLARRTLTVPEELSAGRGHHPGPGAPGGLHRHARPRGPPYRRGE